jgi:2-polyprenyl-3-methyl-5-hydroxy-6-metoxy-1,4-benzoquinol methylase
MNRYNLAAAAVHPGITAVDICSGTGYGTDIMRKAGARAIGIELNPDAVSFARGQYPQTEYIEGDVNVVLGNTLTHGIDQKPDLVTFFEAIEHIPREGGLAILDTVRGALAPDGNFFISTPRDIRSDTNPDHITQWKFDELNDALRGRFRYVEMFGQDWSTGEFVQENPHQASFFVARCSQPMR